MAEAGDIGADVARVEPPTDLQPVTEMDLDTARAILQALVDTHEGTFTAQDPIDQIAGYSTEQIRLAEQVVAQSIVENSDTKTKMNGFNHAQKLTPQGKLELFLNSRSVRLKLANYDEPYVIDNDFLLQEPPDGHKFSTRFAELRSGKVNETSLGGLEGNPTLDGFRHMVRGVRWMSANMLDWGNPNTIMPEQLDNLGLAPVPQGELPQSK